MKKSFFLILIFISSLLGSITGGDNDFLDPEDAFKVSIIKSNDIVSFKLQLDKTIYLYDKFLKVVIKTPKNIDITNELILPQPVNYDGFIVHFGQIVIDVPFSLIKSKIGQDNYELELQYQGCSKKGLCYPPMTKIFKSSNSNVHKIIKEEIVNETDSITQTLQDGSILLILVTFFGFGLLLSLTPCIFPMIPILSSIIVQQSKQQNGNMSAKQGLFLSIVYVLSMSIAYTFAGVLAGLFGANLQAMLQDPVVIVVFASIFVVLAFSMFGYFEIGLPQSWQTALNKRSEASSKKGGIIGVAIMGFLSALIVGPCVAPPLAGALIYIGQTGDALLGAAALFVLSIGMGLPLLAIGIGAGKYMPKPGDWMTAVSKIFGIVMLAIALWMLERVIDSLTFMLLSSLLLIGAALYLKVFEHILAKLITTIIFIYGIAIFVGAISGTTNILDPLESFKSGAKFVKKDKLHWTYIKNIDELDNIISTSSKPIMIDFWASWCVSCKEFENITFKDENVKKQLAQYTLIKIDVTNNSGDDKALMNKFDLFGPPAMIFYANKQENKSKRIIGYKNPKEFLDTIK
ncbi:Cytochrome c-type biogenesis protein DsbD, protein-disulfide reductase [hydrothermal vent metagenome]|uniref:Cytochrome c-type biogenesis protein DsbD, protein-disulfide reductase n=1 Tax=hydrothermal vent metagenome TaxID=652676 RepID=A0A3B1E0T9_9ZZZZ